MYRLFKGQICNLFLCANSGGIQYSHGRMNYKDTKPYMSAFLSVDLLTDFAAFCLTDFIDWGYTHSWFVFSTQLVNCCPHGVGGTILVYCWVLPLYCTFSLTSSPLPPPLPNVQYILYRQCVTVRGGGVEMYCGPYSAGVLHSVSDQIWNLLNCFTALNKMTSEDDIKGLVSLTSFVHEYSLPPRHLLV